MTSSYYRYRSLHTETCLNFICLIWDHFSDCYVLSMFRQACSLQKKKKKWKESNLHSFEELCLFPYQIPIAFQTRFRNFREVPGSDFKFFYWFPDLLPTLDVEDRSQPSPQNLLLATPVFSALMEIDWWSAWKKNELYAVRKNCFVNCLRVVHRC